MNEQTSELVGGRYRVLETLGKGAMGVVYRAHDPVLDRMVAIKRMTAEIAHDPALRQRFYVEARAAARLNHRNIVTVYELGETDQDIFIVMELVEGPALSQLIKQQAALPITSIVELMAQVCDGLDFAHRNGIIHRDIKPANLNVLPSGVVKILDFGIARLGSVHMTASGILIGTPDYMAPEQARGEDIDGRADLFSVGAVIYELVSTVKPFAGGTLGTVITRLIREPHVPLGARVPATPARLSDLVDRLLAKDRRQRPATAGAVRDELQAIGESLRAPAGRASDWDDQAGLEPTLVGLKSPVGTVEVTHGSGPEASPADSAPATPGTAAPGTATPGTAAPGTAAPGTAAPSGDATSAPGLPSAALAAEPATPIPPGDATRPHSLTGSAPGAERRPEIQAPSDRSAVAPASPAAAGEGGGPIALPAPSTDSSPPAGAPLAQAPPAQAPAPAGAAPVVPGVGVRPRQGGGNWGFVAAAVVLMAAGGLGYWWWQGRTAPAAADLRPSGAEAASPGAEALRTPTETAPATSTPVPAAEATAGAAARDATAPRDAGASGVVGDETAAAGKQPAAAMNPAAASTATEPQPRAFDRPSRAETGGAPTREAPAGAGRSAETPPPEGRADRRPAEPRPPAAPTPDPAPRARAELTGETLDAFARPGGGDVASLARSAALVAAENRIRYVIGRYADAFAAKDADALASVRPSPTPAESAWIAASAKVAVRVEGLDVQTSETEGVARGRRIVEGELASGASANESRVVTFRLVRRPSGWIIVEVR